MKISNNLYKVELKRARSGNGKNGAWMDGDSLRHFGLRRLISDEHGEEKRSKQAKRGVWRK